MEYISLLLSVLAVAISISTFLLTRIYRGTIKMTRPSIIFFGPDGRGTEQKKVFIRTLLYSTADRGIYVQNMFIRLQRGESQQNFNVWVYGNNNSDLVRGSGLFINKTGISFNHHFLLPKDGIHYNFLSGEYRLEVFVETTKNMPIKIFDQLLSIDKYQADSMNDQKCGVYFDWAPNSQTYYSHIDKLNMGSTELTSFISKSTEKP
ncbi:hypothetical protein [uncultured Chitinophaga sp.]|uniref:hypothetical protein n=1 Tax=uncultured Chitinophaga sp. TaxID=339340 RepID=UPI0025D62AE8|nr:hypothetical protein [uncultured Chitinophaga sp.]